MFGNTMAWADNYALVSNDVNGVHLERKAASDDGAVQWARVNIAGALSGVPFPVYAHLQDAEHQEYILTRTTQEALTRSGYSYEVIVGAEPDATLYLARYRRPVDRADIPSSTRILYDDGKRLLLIPGNAADCSALSGLGYQLRRLPDTPMNLAVPKQTLLRADSGGITSNALVAAMIANVQRTNLYAMVFELTGEASVMVGGCYTNILTRNTEETNAVNLALNYAQTHLRALGLDVQNQEWSVTNVCGGRNIIAERPGLTAPSEIVIVCGHIDSMPDGPLAPGADDNASGACGVLAAARAMQNYTFDRTLRYVFFTGEEQGLLGSEAYAAAAQTAGDNIVAVYNLDMLSYDSNHDGKLNLHTRLTNNPGYAADLAIASIFTNAVNLYPLESNLTPVIFADAEDCSDHDSFWQNGYSALYEEESWPDDFTPYYHTTNDLIGTMNFTYYTAFVQATVAAAAHSAGVREEIAAAEKVSNAVHAVRIELENSLGKTVPSLNLVLQTSNETFFVSSAASPELAVTTNMTFRFASNTKNFTAASVLHMQQQGWLNIADPITNTIPGFSEPYIPTGTNWAIPNKHLITIEQLLRHSAGVYDVDNDPVPNCGGDSYTGYITSLDPTHQFTVEEMVAQNAVYELSYFAPDEGYHYSNTGFAMLAEIVSRIYSQHSGTDKTLTDYLYDHVIGGDAPQSFPEIRFPNLATDTALPEPFMPGTERRPTNITIIVSNCNMSAQVGEGNGYGTLPALNRYIRHTMKGEGVLSQESIHLMQTDTSPLNAGYALGCTFVQDIGFGHNGCRVGNLSQMNYNPETDVSVAVYLPLVDYSDYPPSFMACFQGIYNAAYRALEALGYPRTPTLAHGSHTNLNLTAGTTNAFYFTAAQGVYYCVKISNTTAEVFCRVAPGTDPEDAVTFTNGFGWYCESPGTYRLTVTPADDTACDLTLLALKMPTPADYSALDWTNAFLAAHAKFSREYAFTEWKSIDWSAMYSNTLPLIEQAQAETNEQAYYAALHAYVGAIPDGHVRLSATNYTVPDAWADAVAGGGYGLALAELDDGRVIAAALVTNGPAQNAGIQTGAEILDWGGITITSALAQIKVSDYPLKALATTMEIDPQATLDHCRLEQARLMVRGPIGTNVEVRFLNPGAESTQTVTLVSVADSKATFSLVNFAWRQDLYADPVDYEILTNGLGYVVLRIEESLTDPSDITTIYNAFGEAIGTFVTSNVPGVIVDLRGNFGGRDDLAAMLSGFFYTSNAFYEGQEWYNEVDGQFTRITLDETGEYPYLDHLSITPQPVCYRGPVAVLANPGTISSGEGMTMAIGRLPQACVIGFYGTDGSFGLCGGSITLPGGYTIQYPYGRSLNEDWNIQLDSQNGVGGVHPEIRVPKTEENVLAFAAGTDVELNVASDYLLGLRNYTNTIAQTSALITNLMEQYSIPALSIALIDGTNIVWAEGFGMANREDGIPADADTIYRIASCSKTFAATSIMRLQDDGLLSLDDAVTNTVPAFSMLPRYPNQSAITIRELLAHQVQLPGCYFRHADSTIPYDGYYDMLLALMAEDYMIEPRHFLEKYNNNGFTLIEGVVAGANTNGLDYAGYAAANLFQPMSMSNTTFRLTGNQTNLLAKVYWNGVPAPDEYVNTPGSGGAYSTASDLARYARFLLNYGTYDGVTILSSNAVAALWSDQSGEVTLVNKEGYAKSGLGWDQIADTSFAYAGRMAWKDGDSLNYSAIICVMPDQGLAAVALNSIPGADTAAAPAAKMALKMALNERFGIPLPSTNPPAFPVSPVTTLTEQELAGIVGMYSAEGGYDLVTGTVSSITWITGADSASPVRHEGLVPHQDGWFCTASDPEFRLAFTNIDGRVIMRRHVRFEEYLRILVQAERFTPAPLSAAWSNCVGKTWVTGDLEPDSYLWLLGFYPTLQLGAADGVLSVYSSPVQTLQPQDDDLAFPLLSSAAQPSALQVKHTNGHEVIRYSGYNFHRRDDLPVLQVGQSSTGTLEAGASALYQFTITDPGWHGIYVTPAGLVLRQETADLSVPGTYSLILQNPDTSSVPYAVRLYNYTSTIARVTTLITNLIEQNNLVGCGFSFVDGTNTILETGFGYADRENQIAATKDTVFMIGSCSKTFGALAAMQLVEEGRLDLDASITNALPDFTIHQRFANNVITPRTILTHHSGLPGDVFNGGFTVRPHVDAPEQIEAMLADDYTLMPTNTYWSYNNSGLVMLDLAIEHLSGMNADDYVRSNLFLRMGMTNSLLRRPADYDFQKIARPYMGDKKGPDEFCNLDIAGSILSTASDMARYMKMLLAGGMGENGRIISNATLQAMWVQQNADIPLDRLFSMMNMGIGFVLDPPWLNYLGKVCWHDGGTLYFRTLLRVAPDAQLGCFVSWNTAEAVAFNGQIVDSTLKWAYEEKTGISPPDPCDPGTPAAAVAPPEIIDLATGGVFVTGSGYDVFETNAVGLVGHLGKQDDGINDLVLVYRDNGWFTPTNDYTTQLLFTQTVGRTLCVMKYFSDGVTNTMIRGERSADINGFDSAWSNRLGTWWATDMYPDDISWFFPTELTVPMIELSTKDDLLLLLAEVVYVMTATNDSPAFAAGLGRNKGSALQSNGDTLAFMGVHYRSQESIPVLTPGTSTNGTTAGDEIYWFQIQVTTSQPITVDLATDDDLTTYLYTTNYAYLGQANRAHAFHHDATNPALIMAAVVRNGTNVGPWTLTRHTNDIPFYQQIPPDDWPAAFSAHSNVYPNTDFGYVFVPENRTNQTGNILKIAVARMNASGPDAKPVFFCNGGPGDSSILCTYQYYLRKFTDEYNMHLIDQRGLGLSQPDLVLRTDETPAELQYRLTMLEDGDLTAVNTLETSCDLDDLAAAYALTNVNIFGQSYGTLITETLMRRDPDWLRAVVLDGVLAPNIPPHSNTGLMRNDALNALFHDVAAHPGASAWYPDFSNTFYALANDLQAHPVDVDVLGQPMHIDGAEFLNAVFTQMTVSDLGTRERIPNIVYRVSAGETAALAELYTGFHANSNMLVNVFGEMVERTIYRHDIIPFDSYEAASNACANLPPLLAANCIDFMKEMFANAELIDPIGQAANTFTNPVTVNRPTLVINGLYDTQTGTNWAAEVAAHLPTAYLVLAPTVGHGVLLASNGCMEQVIRDFLADPSQFPDTTCVSNLSLDFPSPWSTNAAALPVEASLTGSVSRAGLAQWYEIQPDLPGSPVGSVSNVYYEVTLSGAPTNFLMRVCNSTDASLLAERKGNGPLEVPSGASPLYLSIFPDADGVQTGQYDIAFSIPLLVRAMNMRDGRAALIWQGPAEHPVDVESAEHLTDPEAFVPVVTNLPAPDLLNSYTNPPALDAYRFYRIQETGGSNRLGRLVIFSDLHMSPFASQEITEALLAAPVENWDGILATATNGYFTPDATGQDVTSPMLFNAAITNACAACPQPDAVLIPGDLPYYYFDTYYQTITGDFDDAHWKTLLGKMYSYIHLKISQTFPDAPIHFCLGNNDTFGEDYQISSTDGYFSVTAPVWYGGTFTNATSYADFTATYTNAGNYSAPFGRGEIISVESVYFSVNYTGPDSDGSNQIAFLDQRLQACADAGRPAYVLMHIPPGADPYATWSLWKTGQTDTVSTAWKPEFISPVLDLFARHTGTVAGVFSGHYHNRYWLLANDPATSNVTATIHGMSGVFYNHGNNPAFTVMTYDRNTFDLLREYTYSIDRTVYTGKTGPTQWTLRYSMNEGFGVDELNPEILLPAWSDMSGASSAGALYFNQEYSGGHQPYAMTSTNWPIYYGTIRWLTPTQFLDNVHW